MARAALTAIAVGLLLTSVIIPLAWSRPAQSWSRGSNGLLFIVSVDKRIYVTGEAIGIRLVLINPTLSEIDFGYVGADWIDFEILSGGAVLYRASDHWVIPAEVWRQTMAPLEVMELIFVHGDSDYSLSAGAYQVRGVVEDDAEGYASLVVVDFLPALLLRVLIAALGSGLAAILVYIAGYALTRRPASKRS